MHLAIAKRFFGTLESNLNVRGHFLICSTAFREIRNSKDHTVHFKPQRNNFVETNSMKLFRRTGDDLVHHSWMLLNAEVTHDTNAPSLRTVDRQYTTTDST